MRKFATLMVGSLVLVGAARAEAGVFVDVRIGSPAPCPPPVVYAPAACPPGQMWVPPVTQTVVQNVWHDPVTQDQVSQQWVPDQYELRDATVPDQFGRPVTVKQNVLVAPGHWQDVHTPVTVRAGYWGPEAQTVVVVPGHWDVIAPSPVFVPVGPPPFYPQPGFGRPDHFHDHYDPRYDRGYGPGPGYGPGYHH